MYDREVDVPRLLGHFRLTPEAARMPDAIRAAAQRVSAATVFDPGGHPHEPPALTPRWQPEPVTDINQSRRAA